MALRVQMARGRCVDGAQMGRPWVAGPRVAAERGDPRRQPLSGTVVFRVELWQARPPLDGLWRRRLGESGRRR